MEKSTHQTFITTSSEGQETGAIVPAPENARKKNLRGVIDRARKKNLFFIF
jgi:hypothetical protein